MSAILTTFFIFLAFFWAGWIILKRDMVLTPAKLVYYFIGVVLALLIVMWMVAWFLPWWGKTLYNTIQASPNIDNLEVIAADLWSDVSTMDAAPVVSEGPITQPTQQPVVVVPVNPTPVPTVVVVPQAANPALSASEQTYVVKERDTLYSLQRQFGVPVARIKERNNLSSDLIRPGQTLIIPAP